MYIDNIPETVNSVDKVKKFVGYDSVNYIRRFGRISTCPHKFILMTDSYESIIKLLNILEKTEDFTNVEFISKLEKVQTKFFKFVFNSNRYAK